MRSAIKSSALKHGILFLLILSWTIYSEFDRPAHIIGLLVVTASFLRMLYLLRPVPRRYVPPSNTDFESAEVTNLSRPTVLRRRDQSHLRVV
jgi:hypothetical protein